MPYYATISLGEPDEEIVLVTAVSGSTATVTRAQDGSTAVLHLAAATFDQTVIAKDFDEANEHVTSTSGVHGIVGSVVGTTDAQTLSSKTIDTTCTLKALWTGTATEYAALTPTNGVVYVVSG